MQMATCPMKASCHQAARIAVIVSLLPPGSSHNCRKAAKNTGNTAESIHNAAIGKAAKKSGNTTESITNDMLVPCKHPATRHLAKEAKPRESQGPAAPGPDLSSPLGVSTLLEFIDIILMLTYAILIICLGGKVYMDGIISKLSISN